MTRKETVSVQPPKPNCPTERMKVSVAALSLLILILTITSAVHSQPSECTCPCRAAVRKANGTAGSEVVLGVLSSALGPLPSCTQSCCLQTLPFVSRAELWSRSFWGWAVSGSWVRVTSGIPKTDSRNDHLGGIAKEEAEEIIINVCDEEEGKASG